MSIEVENGKTRNTPKTKRFASAGQGAFRLRIILLGEVIAFDTCRLVRRLMETGFTWAQTEEALLDGRNRLLNGSLVYRQDC